MHFGLREDEFQQLVVGHDAVQPVRAEDKLVAGFHGFDGHVGAFADFVGAEVFPQHVLELVLAGLFALMVLAWTSASANE